MLRSIMDHETVQFSTGFLFHRFRHTGQIPAGGIVDYSERTPWADSESADIGECTRMMN